jgi:S-adenosylmethionine hydrolase
MPLLTLTTDFGTGSPYVAEMKGVILSAVPEATLVDLTHAIPPQDVRTGAMLLDQMTRAFPPGAIHVAVVDPGVGTARRLVCVGMSTAAGGGIFLAPDNGLLTFILRRGPHVARTIENAALWRNPVSPTFHGRDILAPVAAAIARGTPLDSIGSRVDDLTLLDWAEAKYGPRSIEGEIVFIDSFGNCVTNIPLSHQCFVKQPLAIRAAGRDRVPLVRTYAEAAPGTLVALVGSGNWLEIAVVNGSAAASGIALGLPVVVSW